MKKRRLLFTVILFILSYEVHAGGWLQEPGRLFKETITGKKNHITGGLPKITFRPLFGPNCGSGPNTHVVPDELILLTGLAAMRGSAKFYRSCKKHDRCYDTCGASMSSCDKQFHRDLRSECAAAFNTVIAKPAKNSCYIWAKGYYKAVAGMAKDAYRSAQKKACR